MDAAVADIQRDAGERGAGCAEAMERAVLLGSLDAVRKCIPPGDDGARAMLARYGRHRWKGLLAFLSAAPASRERLALAAERVRLEVECGKLLRGVAGLDAARAGGERGGRDYFKCVAVVGGRHLSVYDGVTEYVRGETLRQEFVEGATSGFFVFRSVAEAAACRFPGESRLPRTPRAVLRVGVGGRVREAASGALVVEEVTVRDVACLLAKGE